MEFSGLLVKLLLLPSPAVERKRERSHGGRENGEMVDEGDGEMEAAGSVCRRKKWERKREERRRPVDGRKKWRKGEENGERVEATGGGGLVREREGEGRAAEDSPTTSWPIQDLLELSLPTSEAPSKSKKKSKEKVSEPTSGASYLFFDGGSGLLDFTIAEALKWKYAGPPAASLVQYSQPSAEHFHAADPALHQGISQPLLIEESRELRPAEHGLTTTQNSSATRNDDIPEMLSFFCGKGRRNIEPPVALQLAKNLTWIGGADDRGEMSVHQTPKNHVRQVLLIFSLVCGATGVVLLAVSVLKGAWKDLPEELVHNILSPLIGRDFAALQAVCKSWKSASTTSFAIRTPCLLMCSNDTSTLHYPISNSFVVGTDNDLGDLGDKSLFISNAATFVETISAKGAEKKVYLPCFRGRGNKQMALFYCLATRRYKSFGADWAACSYTCLYESTRPASTTWIKPVSHHLITSCNDPQFEFTSW
ncbi:hypothetical protein HAX54_037477 [Datura stramonium]|uniref:F-box domain-containing protein n=1 Tax=Datura stramonium TaxID=4076 RepID=A0ABS8VIB9_DATST|nr:hypothetical protein [Datura stramonium]